MLHIDPWPNRQSRNRCIRPKILEYHLDLWTWLNSVQMRTPNGSRWMSNNYITRFHRRLELVGVRVGLFEVGVPVAVPVGDKMPAWESACRLRACSPQWPPVEQPNRMRKRCCYGQKNLRSICSSLFPSPTHLSHITYINPFATLSRIKCEWYIFLKKCVRSFIIVDYVSVYSCICVCGYTTHRVPCLSRYPSQSLHLPGRSSRLQQVSAESRFI